MAVRFDDLVYIALVLAVIAVVATAPADGAQTVQKLRWLLAVSTTPDAVVTDGAIDGTMTFPVSPGARFAPAHPPSARKGKSRPAGVPSGEQLDQEGAIAL